MTDYNILCLHGFSSSSAIFESKNHIQKILQKSIKDANFYYLNGTHTIKGEEETFCWFYYDKDNILNIDWDLINNINYNEIDKSMKGQPLGGLIGIQESTEYLLKYIKEKNINCIIGFSQGGAMLYHLLNEKLIDQNIPCIFIGAFKPYHQNPNADKIQNKSLHMMGENDTVIKPELSHNLYDRFNDENKNIIVHNGKHVVSNNGESKRRIKEFFGIKK